MKKTYIKPFTELLPVYRHPGLPAASGGDEGGEIHNGDDTPEDDNTDPTKPGGNNPFDPANGDGKKHYWDDDDDEPWGSGVRPFTW